MLERTNNMQYLTAKEVATTVLKRWEFLGAVRGKTECLYDYGEGVGCAIGVCLTQNSINQVLSKGLNSASADELHEAGIIHFVEDDVRRIQRAHDSSVIRRAWKPSEEVEEYLAELRAFCERLVGREL